MAIQQREAPPAAPPATARTERFTWRSLLRIETALVIAIAVTWAVFGAVGQGFFSQYSIFQVTQVIASSLLIGFAQMVVLVTGRLNLAVGGIGVVCIMIAGNLMAGMGVPWVLALLVSVLAGAAIGAVIGLLEANTRIGSFVITLASLSILTGGMYIVTKAQPVSLPADVRALGAGGFISPSISALLIPSLLIAAALWYLYSMTTFGREAKAIGFSEKAAATSGVRVKGILVATFVLSGALCAIAAFIQSARVGAVLPSLGEDWVIASFIVPVLGGTALTGGRVSVIGAVLGAVFLTSANTGLISIGLPSTWLIFAQGVVLLAVILVQALLRKRATR
jgi:ribose transport system permease protein